VNPPDAPAVCVVGLGLMGRPLARALDESGYDVRGWNRSPLAAELTEGIRLVPDLAEAARAEVVVFMLSDSDALADVLVRLEPSLRARDQILVDMGTSRPSDSVERAGRLAARGLGWVDAPVSGGPEGIVERRLAIMAGGTDEDVARVEPLLSQVGNVVHVGGPGAGHTVKLINQVIVPLTIEAVAEALALAERCGLDLELVRAALRGGSADSRILEVQGSRMIAHDYTPGGKATIMLKDLHMISGLADSVGLDLPHVTSTLALYEQLVRRGEGELDCSALHKLRLTDAR
jgi:2-hydroxy-3-oxopropionate reductase